MDLALFCCLFMLKEMINIMRIWKIFQDFLKIICPVIIFINYIVFISRITFSRFFAKFYIFMAVIEQSMFLAIIGLSTVIAAFYYLRIIKIIYFDQSKEKFE